MAQDMQINSDDSGDNGERSTMMHLARARKRWKRALDDYPFLGPVKVVLLNPMVGLDSILEDICTTMLVNGGVKEECMNMKDDLVHHMARVIERVGEITWVMDFIENSQKISRTPGHRFRYVGLS